MPDQIEALPALWSRTLHTSCHQDKTWDISNFKGEILFFLMVWEGSVHGYLPSCLDIMMTRNRKRDAGQDGQSSVSKDTTIPTDLLPLTASTSYLRHFPTIPSRYNLVKWLMRLLCWTSQDLTDSETSTQTNQGFALLISWAFLNPIKWQLWLTI